MKSKPNESSAWQKALITAIISAVVIVLINVALLLLSLNKPIIKLNENFTMRAGDQAVLQDSGDHKLELVNILDGRCPENEDIVCSWEGQIYYKFNYDGTEITVGSVLDDDTSRPLEGNITINFVSGDERNGTFVLRNSAE